VYTNQQIYSTQHPLLVYGTGPENSPLILRLFAPDGTIAEFEQIITNSDGSFSHKMLDWPSSSTKYPFGTYTIEAITNTGESKKIDIKFASSTELELIPIERKITTQVFAPEMAAADRPFRVFVQVTSDGLLVSGDAKKVLSSSHIHSPDGKVQSLAMSVEMLHEGLYFVEYTPRTEGTYIFHMVAFSQGTQSHGSAATLVLGQVLGGISMQIVILEFPQKQNSNSDLFLWHQCKPALHFQEDEIHIVQDHQYLDNLLFFLAFLNPWQMKLYLV